MKTTKRFAFDTVSRTVFEDPKFRSVGKGWTMLSGKIHETVESTGSYPVTKFLCDLSSDIKDRVETDENRMRELLVCVSRHSQNHKSIGKMILRCFVWLFSVSLVDLECRTPVLKSGRYLTGRTLEFEAPVDNNHMNRFIFSDHVGDFATKVI